MCLNKTYKKVGIGKNSTDIFPVENGLKGGDNISLLLYNFASDYAMLKVQVSQDGLELKGIHQLLVYAADYNNILGVSIQTVKENAEALVVAIKETGLELNADKTKYVVVSRDQNARRRHSTKTDNTFFERVEEFRYLGTILTKKKFS